jgi:hypothetical protein
MSGITLNNINNNNFDMGISKLNNEPYMEEPFSLNEKQLYSNLLKKDFSDLSPKEKALNIHYTQNKLAYNTDDTNSSINKTNVVKKVIRSISETCPHSKWSDNSKVLSNSELQQKNILIDLVQSVKLYNDDICFMINDLFKTNTENNKADLNYFDVEDFFKYSLIVGQQECTVSEKLINTIRHFSRRIVDQSQEIKRLQKQVTDYSVNKYFNSLKKISKIFKSSDNKNMMESSFQIDDFNYECMKHLEKIIEQVDKNEIYYQSQIQDLLNEIHQRDDLLDCYQKRENNLFNFYYPKLIGKIEKSNLSKYQNKEAIVNEMAQQLKEIEKAFQDKLVMKNNLIEEINNQKSFMEICYIKKLKAKEEIISSIHKHYKEKEKFYQNEISQYKKRSADQAKLAEQIRNQIQNQQNEYCKKVEEMQQNLDSRGKIIAYVQNKLNIRENELKIANIKFTTAERQMNIEKDQYKREISNLKEEIEKTNEDIEDLENELDTQEEEYKGELERLEKEHDIQINKLWNIIDQRENTINEMETEMEKLKEKTNSMEQSILKFEKEKEKSEDHTNEKVIEEEILAFDMNEKSNITVTGDASEKSNITVTGVASKEIIIINNDCTNSNRASVQEKEYDYSADILLSEYSNNDCEEDMIEGEKGGLTSTEEKYDADDDNDDDYDDDETNSLTLTEDMSKDESEIGERRELIEELEEEGENDFENEFNEENEKLKHQYDALKQENTNLRYELEKEKENLKRENEKCKLQLKQYEEITLKYSQICSEKEDIMNHNAILENEISKKLKEQKIQEELNNSLEQKLTDFQKEKDDLENRVKQLEKTVNDAVSLEKYNTLRKEFDVALENANEQRRKKNYLKQKLANQQEKNKVLIELIKKERVKNKEEIRKLKQSCVKQNSKIKAVLKQVKDGLVIGEHIDLDRIVKRVKSERLLMNNEYERLKKVASTLSNKSNSNLKKQSIVLKNENFSDIRKDSNREGSVEITIKNPTISKNISNESKIFIKVAPNFESLHEESMASKQANDSLNSIETDDENQEVEKFSLKKALGQQDGINYLDEDDDRNSFIDFTTPSSYELIEKRENEINSPSFNNKEDISLIEEEEEKEENTMTPQQVNLYNRILQIPGVLPFSINEIKNLEYDDANFSISTDSSMYNKEGEGYLDRNEEGLEAISTNRIRYNSYSNNELKNGNNHNSLRRMPNFDQIAKLAKIKIKHSSEEIMA